MSIKADINKKDLIPDNELKVHFIPATIDGNGPIKIDEYFNSYTTEDNGVLSNALRGYPLKGCELKIPEDMKGIVLRENEQLDENADRELKFSGHFDQFTYWNFDKVPSQNDGYRKVLQWQEISEALHTRVESLD